MLINADKKLVFQLHQKTASRQTRNILERRGFELFYGHHDSFTSDNNPTPGITQVMTYSMACTVRDHFDYFLTRWTQEKNIGKHDEEFITVEWLQGHRQAQPAWALMRGKLWHLWWEMHAMWSVMGVGDVYDSYPTTLFFESLRDDLDTYLAACDLAPIEDREWSNAWTTDNKPRRQMPYRYFHENAIDWINHRFGTERELLGYPTIGRHYGRR